MNITTTGRHRQSAWLGFRPVAVLLSLLALLVVLAACGGTTAEITPTEEPKTPAASTEPEPEPPPVVEETTEPEPEPAPEPEPEPEAPEFTAAQEQAIGSAEDYLSFSAFSRKGLIEQLMFEGFSEAEATFAVDHITVDWKEQAVKSAKNYLDIMHFSRSGLIDQLVFEGFTTEQAEYGVSGAGL